MTKKELYVIRKSVQLALRNAASHGGASSDRGLGMRYSAYDIANEVWYEIILPKPNLRNLYLNRDAWMKDCGFQTDFSV